MNAKNVEGGLTPMGKKKAVTPESYSIRCNCGNCGRTFSATIPFGTDVSTGNWTGTVLFVGHDLVTCPNCGSTQISKGW